MNTIQQQFQVPFSYPVIFTSKLFNAKNTALASFLASQKGQKPARVFFLADSGVAKAHPGLAGQVSAYCATHTEALQQAGEFTVLPGGEQCKNDTDYLMKILEAVDRYGIDRHSYIAAIGGGALLDLAGFAAAIAHRGIRHIRIPTTVLSQNDSGVGVKNSINFFGKKNFLGTFAPPVAVFNDADFLETLHERDWRSGIAEAVKVALIKDKAFFDRLLADAPALATRDREAMQYLVHRCAQMHVDHIGGGDPFESGSSRPLDFGHWAAHKLEQLTRYELRHGEAVAIGIALDVTYCYLKNMIGQKDWEQVLGLLQTVGFSIFAAELESKNAAGEYELLNGLQEFREHLGGELTIMLLEAVGKGKEVHEIDQATVLQSISTLRQVHEKTVSGAI